MAQTSWKPRHIELALIAEAPPMFIMQSMINLKPTRSSQSSWPRPWWWGWVADREPGAGWWRRPHKGCRATAVNAASLPRQRSAAACRRGARHSACRGRCRSRWLPYGGGSRGSRPHRPSDTYGRPRAPLLIAEEVQTRQGFGPSCEPNHQPDDIWEQPVQFCQ